MNIRKVTGISMNVLSSAEIINLSQGELTELAEEKNDQYDKIIDPIYHPRQGVYPEPHGGSCVVCASSKNCTGHPMHIMLEYPVMNPCLSKEVIYVLSCICPHCKRTIYPEKKCQTLGIQSTGVKRMKNIQKRLKKDRICSWDDCQTILPKYEIRGEYIYYWYEDAQDPETNEENKTNDEDSDEEMTPVCTSTVKGKGKRKVATVAKKKTTIAKTKKMAIRKEPADIIELFKCLSQDDFDNLGFNNKLPSNPIYTRPDIQVRAGQVHRLSFRPEDMFLRAFPIASKIIAAQDEENDDVIAQKYRNIFKNNLKLKRHRLGKNPIDKEKDLADIKHRITQDVCVLIDNTSTKSIQPHNHREMKTWAHFVKGKRNKAAIFRNNINGKRLEGNGRTVVGPGVFQKSYEVGIPKCIADILTNDVYVWGYNIESLQKHIDQTIEDTKRSNERTGVIIGWEPKIEEKLLYVVRKQKKIYLRPATKNYTERFLLQEGDMVSLKLESGNWGHFNRQPSLRKESYQGVKTKILPSGKNFRLPLCMVTPYNADFDGRQ